MQNLTSAAPIVPGKLDEWRRFNDEMHARWEEPTVSGDEMGLTQEVATLMQTPGGDFVCLCHEAEDLAGAFTVLAISGSPYLVWSRGKLIAFHGLTPEMLEGPLPAEVKVHCAA